MRFNAFVPSVARTTSQARPRPAACAQCHVALLIALTGFAVVRPLEVSAQVFRTETITIESAITGMTLTSYVCVPSDYDDHPDRRYSVMYDFPGGTQPSQNDCGVWGGLVEMMDMDPFIRISIEGRNEYSAGYYLRWNTWSNSPVSGRWVDYVVKEVVPAMDAKYRTVADPMHRVTTGISGGGYGSIWIPLRHPEIFANASSLSGVFHFIDPCDLQPTPRMEGLPYERTFKGTILSGYGSPPYTFKPTDHELGNSLYTFAAAYSPNVNNPPYRVDLPWDASGNNNLDVCRRWLEHNPANVVDELPPGTDLYFNIGLWTLDNLGPLAEMSRVLIDSLDANGIPVDTLSVPCGHGHDCPDDGVIYTMQRERLWNLNNWIKRGAFSSSRAPAPLVVTTPHYSFGSVGSQGPPKIIDVINFGPGSVEVTATLDTTFFSVSPSSFSIAEGDTVGLEVTFEYDSLSRNRSHNDRIALAHSGVGMPAIVLYGNATGVGTETLPAAVNRFAVYPNPVELGRPISVEFELSAAQWVEASVVDLLGRERAILLSREHHDSGLRVLKWAARDVTAGTYFVRLETSQGIANRPVVIVR